MKPSPNLNLLDALAQGHIDSPASGARHPSDRWRWFAGLCAERAWVLVAAVPEFPRPVPDQIAAVSMISATHEQRAA